MAKFNPKASGHTPVWHGSGKYITNCSQCPAIHINPPANAIGVRKGQKSAKCKNGHEFKLHPYTMESI